MPSQRQDLGRNSVLEKMERRHPVSKFAVPDSLRKFCGYNERIDNDQTVPEKGFFRTYGFKVEDFSVFMKNIPQLRKQRLFEAN